MSTDINKEPNYELLVDALLEKSRDGKIDWKETAEEGTYIAAVRGEQTYEINQRFADRITDVLMPSRTPSVFVTVINSTGDRRFTTPEMKSAAAQELYRLASRIAEGIDEKVDEALEFLNNL